MYHSAPPKRVTCADTMSPIAPSATRWYVSTDLTADNRQSLLIGFFSRNQNPLGPYGIHCARFLDKTVLALFDGIFEMHRAEYRRRTQQHDIHARVDHFLVGVETEEAIFVGYLLSLIFQRLPARVQLVGKHVSQSRDLQTGTGIQKIASRSGAAASAADQPRFQRTAFRRAGQYLGNRYRYFFLRRRATRQQSGHADRTQNAQSSQRGTFDKISTT